MTPSANAKYPSTLSSWPDEGAIQILGVDGVRIAIFSYLSFAMVLDWDCILLATLAEFRENGRILTIAEDAIAIYLVSPPTVGHYRYNREDSPEIHPHFLARPSLPV